MSQITINLKTDNPAELAIIRIALEKLGNNITPFNLQFLAELSTKQNINEKLNKNKTTIKTFL